MKAWEDKTFDHVTGDDWRKDAINVFLVPTQRSARVRAESIEEAS